MAKRISVLLFLVASAVTGECVNIGPKLTARFAISSFAFDGQPIESSVEIKDAVKGKRFSIDKPIPYGTYWMLIQAPGFRSQETRIVVADPTVSLRVTLQLEAECESGAKPLKGLIENVRGRDLWVKAVQVFGTETREAHVDKKWNFQVTVPYGSYIVIIAEGKTILSTRTVYQREFLVFDLDS